MSEFTARISPDKITEFCRKWMIRELALFGPALCDDFGPNSAMGIMVTFMPDAEWGLLEHIQMQQELQVLLRHNVVLVSKRGVARSQNWLRQQEILHTAQLLFSDQQVRSMT